MKNITVKDFIEILKTKDPDAIVCRLAEDDTAGEHYNNAVVEIDEFEGEFLSNVEADFVRGKIVVLY